MNAAEPRAAALRLAVIGAGHSGRGFALLCLMRGHHVTLEDVMPAKLRSAAQEFQELVSAEEMGQLDLVTTVEDAVRDADIAIDFVPDELESKLEIFSMIDRMAPPKTILLTPSNALSIADLASCTYRPRRCFALSGLSTPVAVELPGAAVELRPSAAVELQHPADPDSGALATVASLLESLGIAHRVTLNHLPSMLAGR